MHKRKRPERVLIIGTGMAGLKLAHTLMKEDPRINIQFIEANDYVGGRLRTSKFDDVTVELGANWVHGMEGKSVNPIWKLVVEKQLTGRVVDDKHDKF
jgi:protoporphyrinogen oxidase